MPFGRRVKGKSVPRRLTNLRGETERRGRHTLGLYPFQPSTILLVREFPLAGAPCADVLDRAVAVQPFDD
jgi:hypothetical protein